MLCNVQCVLQWDHVATEIGNGRTAAQCLAQYLRASRLTAPAKWHGEHACLQACLVHLGQYMGSTWAVHGRATQSHNACGAPSEIPPPLPY